MTVAFALIASIAAVLLLVGTYLMVRWETKPQANFDPPSYVYATTDAARAAGSAQVPTEHTALDEVRDVAVHGHRRGVAFTLRSFRKWSIIAVSATVGFSALVGWLFTGFALRPVDAITRRARQLSGTAGFEPIGATGPDDQLRRMAEAFDALLERTHRALAGERRLAATMSHELRTPLTNIRLALDVALDDDMTTAGEFRTLAGQVLEQAHRASTMVEGMLALARAEANVEPLAVEPVDIEVLVRDKLDAIGAGSHPHRDLDVVGQGPMLVCGHPALISVLVANLLDNARKHAAADGGIRVLLAAGDLGAESHPSREVILEVANSSAQISAAEIEELLQPFRRGQDAGGSGVGLGLSIVEAIVNQHSGRLSVNGRSGGGFVVRVILPAVCPAERDVATRPKV